MGDENALKTEMIKLEDDFNKKNQELVEKNEKLCGSMEALTNAMTLLLDQTKLISTRSEARLDDIASQIEASKAEPSLSRTNSVPSKAKICAPNEFYDNSRDDARKFCASPLIPVKVFTNKQGDIFTTNDIK